MTDEPLLTRRDLGYYLFLVGDVIVIAFVLAVIGLIPYWVVGVLVVLSIVGLVGWVGLRWWRREAVDTEEYHERVYEKLADAHVDGDLSEATYDRLADDVSDLRTQHVEGEMTDEEYERALDRILEEIEDD